MSITDGAGGFGPRNEPLFRVPESSAWLRDINLAEAKRELEKQTGLAVLRKRAEIRRETRGISGEPHDRIEFGSTGSKTHGILMVAHDRGQNTLNIHGHSILMSELDRDLQEAIFSTSAAFNRATTDEEQANQARIVGLIVTEAMRRDAKLSDRVRETKMRERLE